jgi:hypothetical protein
MSILAQADLDTAVAAARMQRDAESADMSETTSPATVSVLTIPGERAQRAHFSSEFSTPLTFGCLGEKTR